MLIATFNSATGWAGKTITLENEQFILEEHGPITAHDVAEYDRQGYLTWPYDGMRAWLYARAEGLEPTITREPAEPSKPARSATDGPDVQGRLGYFHLGEWWLAAFTEEERAYIEEKYDPLGEKGLTQGNTVWSGTPASTLVSLSTWFAGPGDRHLAMRMLEKADSLAGSNILDRHLVYGQMVKDCYAEREAQPGAFEAAIAACERQTAIGAQAWAAFVAESEERDRKHAEWTGEYESSFVAPSHRGFVQLATIREKQGDFTEALRLCREASSQGWRDGKGDWSKRISRLERRLSKTG